MTPPAGACPCGKTARENANLCKDCITRYANMRQMAFAIDFGVPFLACVFGGAALEERFGDTGNYLALLIIAVVLVLFLARDAFGSPGKRLFGLRVIDAQTGRPASVVQSIKRNLVSIPMLVIPFAPPAASRQAPRFGDSWAATRVVLREFQSRTPQFVPQVE